MEKDLVVEIKGFDDDYADYKTIAVWINPKHIPQTNDYFDDNTGGWWTVNYVLWYNQYSCEIRMTK